MKGIYMLEYQKINGGISLKKYTGFDSTITIPDTIDNEPIIAIGDSAFKDSILTSIKLPDTIEVFGNSAFWGCKRLVDINMPTNLKIVKKNVFFNCEGLTEITFPIGVEKIGPSCFIGCTSLTHLFALNENAVLSKTSLSTFYNFKIQEISFHLIKSLDPKHQAIFIIRFFNDWDNIEQSKKDEIWTIIKKGKNVKDILFLSGEFSIISELLNNKINPNLESTQLYLDHYIKQKNTAITATLLDYKNKKFKKQEIDDVNERKELVEIGLEEMNFNEFKKLWSCSKKDGKIRVNGYFGKDREVTIPAQIDGMPITSMGKTPSKSYIPQKVKILNIEAPLEIILDNCFANYEYLTKVNIPDTVTSIEKYAFSQCRKLEEIVLPESLISMDNYVFHCCLNLNSIIIPKNVTSMGKYVFAICRKLNKVEILANINTIDAYTFSECDNLNDVILPNSITSIERRAFYYCSGLQEINLPENLVKIEKEAFNLCENLTNITFSNSLEHIGSMAFNGCSSLEEIIIPASVKFIGDKAFSGCKNLKNVVFLGDIPELGKNVFKGTPVEKKYKEI